MKLADALILSFSAAMVIIGTHQTITGGISYSYPIFMLAVALLFWYKYRQGKHPDEQAKPTPKAVKQKQKSRKQK